MAVTGLDHGSCGNQAQNPFLSGRPDGPGGAPTPPPGAGFTCPAARLRLDERAGVRNPGDGPAAGSDTWRSAPPPGYYPIGGPPPPWYS